MNVAELIEKLKTFPATARVIVDGYEDDCDDIRAVRLQPIKAFSNVTDFFPPFGDDMSRAECGMGKHVECREVDATEIAVFIMRDGTLK